MRLVLMMIKDFATKYRLKITLEPCGDMIIPGKQGQIYEQAEDALAVMFMPPSKTDKWGRWCPKLWGNLRRAAELVGMTLLLNGDSEGCLGFDPGVKEQVKMALKIAKVRVKQQVPEVRRAALAARLATIRENRSRA